MNALASFDLSPLFRSSVGFDRISDVLDKAFSTDIKGQSYPPYNIEKHSDDSYAIVMAVAGFAAKDIEITSHNNTLKISGKITEETENKTKTYLHRGIATRSFERTFNLDNYVKVKGAEIADGLLKIELQREVPEEAKPKVIEIKSATAPKRIEQKK